MTDLASLRRAVPGLVTSESPVDRMAYARDLWPRHHIDVRRGLLPQPPALVVWPETTEQVASVVRFCADNGVDIVPYGAGSGVCAGVQPRASSLIIDVKRMGRVRSLSPETSTISVEAGAMGITLEDWLGERGHTIGHFPSSILCSTVGGWLAGRGAGQCSGRYGKIEDMVVDLELVDGRGEVRTLRRRHDGPDLTPLVVGSEGTFGVITRATLRLHNAATRKALCSFAFPTTEAGFEAMRAMFQAGLRPAVSRLYDPFDSFMARQGGVKKSKGKKGGASAPAEAVVRGVLRAPSLLNGVVDALGSFALGGSLLVLIFEGDGDWVHDDALAATRLAASFSGKPLGEGPAERWLAHRYSVSYRQAPIFMAGAFSDTMEVSAPWSRLGALYEGVRKALSKHVFVMAHFSHAYPDGCSIYFTFAGSAATEQEALATYDAAWRDGLDAVLAAGASISHHHGTGRSKAPRMGPEMGHGVEVLRKLMTAFDPARICNPGNLLPLPGAPPPMPADPDQGPSIDDRSLLARLPASMKLADARRLVEARGFVSPFPAQSPDGETVGSWVERGAPGAPDRFADPVDHLLAGLLARMPSGDLLRVRPAPRRATGPDQIALFEGCGGRFGELLSVDIRIGRHGGAARPIAYNGPRNPPVGADEEALLGEIGKALGAKAV